MDPHIIDPFDDCPWRSPREILARYGYSPLPSSQLDDRQLPGRLWEMLYAAAARRFFFHDTDHLNDRELYSILWENWLDHPTADIPLEAETNTRLSLAEFDARGMSAEEIYLRYYAAEEDREQWRSSEPELDFPAHIPQKQKPPFNRDWRLPKGPF